MVAAFGGMQVAGNPYQAPSAAVDDGDAPAGDAERIRREHIGHERQLRAVGSLYLFGGALGLLGGIALLADTLGSPASAGETIAIAVVYMGIALAALVVGWGYRRLAPWVRIPGTVLAAAGLLGIPVGTIISAVILWMIWSHPGKVVLSPQYAAIVAATPHVRYTMRPIERIVWGVFIVALVGLVLLLVLER
jgi:hypothetical protein